MITLRDEYCNSNRALTSAEQKLVIAKVSDGDGCVLQKLMTVCTTWQNLIGSQDADVQLWKPVFDMHEKQVTYPIDLSHFQLYQEKLKISIATRKEDFLQLLNSINASFNVTPPVNEKSDLSDLFEWFILNNQFETLALCLLFRPSFDAKKIAQILVRSLDNGGMMANKMFCEQLLIKLHYNVPKLFQVVTRQTAITQCLSMACSGITIGDLLKCGIDFSTFDWNVHSPEYNHSFLYKSFEIMFCSFYPRAAYGENSTFVTPPPALPSSFTDEKLDGYKRTDPMSEEEVKQFLRDLVFNCNLDLDIEIKRGGPFGPIHSALAYWRRLANSQYLPPNNVFKVVLDEYDLAKSST